MVGLNRCWTEREAYKDLDTSEKRKHERADRIAFFLQNRRVTRGSELHEDLKKALYYYLKINEPDTFLRLFTYPERRYYVPLDSEAPEKNYSLWGYQPDLQMVGACGNQLRGRKERITARPYIWLEIETKPNRVCEKLGWIIVLSQSEEFVPPDMVIFCIPPFGSSAIRSIRYRRRFDQGESFTLADFQKEFLEGIRKLAGVLSDCQIRLYELDLEGCQGKRLL